MLSYKHKELISAYADGWIFKCILDDSASFEKACDPIGDRFPMLCRFADGLASVFPGAVVTR